ncbi:alpha/beta fold hydrolase [Pseudarthrobacter sp. NPDC092419]|uniref:alpha/beta fold hydrolase n=1 Tax=Pseudarthrobacter sp. NPDC092419 TaxID=3364414 RepID=UPI003824040B
MDPGVVDLRLRTGITVPCLVAGDADAPPVLLLHAWAESRCSFDRLIPLLSGFRVYAPDLRGQGDADKPEAGYSLREQAEDAAAILDALDVRRAFVVGSSSGGYVAQQLAVAHPGKVAALVLAGSPLSLQGRTEFADEVDALADPVDEDWVRDSLTWFPLQHEVPRWYVEDRVRDGLRMPAHVWKSILAGRIDASVLKIYPRVGHLVLWECPNRVAKDAAAFFRSHAQGPGQPGPGHTAGSLVGRVKAAYDNLPLPFPVVAAMAADLLLARLRPMPLPGSRALHRASGTALVIAGLGLNAWALAERRRNSPGPFALERPEELVTNGPYAFSRHPMYVGWWLIELGAGTLAGSAWVLVTMPAELLVEHPVVREEEATLAGLFGASYRDYAAKVPRYLGHAGLPNPLTTLRTGAIIMTERHLTVRRQSAASAASIWAVLADFPNLARVWDGIKASEGIGGRTAGLGARRRVRLSPFGSMVETVTAWKEHQELGTVNKPSALVPFKQAHSRLTLEPAGSGTSMTFHYRYVPRGGPLGTLTGIAIDRMLTATFTSMLAAIDKAAVKAG